MNTSTIKVTAPPMEPPTIRSNILSSSRYQNKRTQTKSIQNVLTKTREDKKKEGKKNKPMLSITNNKSIPFGYLGWISQEVKTYLISSKDELGRVTRPNLELALSFGTSLKIELLITLCEIDT